MLLLTGIKMLFFFLFLPMNTQTGQNGPETHKATKFFSQSRSLRAQTGTQASSCSYLFMSFKIFFTVFCSWEFKSLIDSEWGKKRFKWLVVLFTLEINKCMNSELLCQLQICIIVKNCCLRGSFQQMVLISLRPLYETFVFSRKCPTFLYFPRILQLQSTKSILTNRLRFAFSEWDLLFPTDTVLFVSFML